MAQTVHAELSANVGRILVEPGDPVEDRTPMVILESMTVEIPVFAGAEGVVLYLHVAEGDTVRPGQPLVDLSTE